MGAKLDVCVLCIAELESEAMVSLITLMLFQDPDMSVY